MSWMSRKYFSPCRGETSFLTSLFIELTGWRFSPSISTRIPSNGCPEVWHSLNGRYRWSSWGMKPCEGLKQLRHVACIVVRSKGHSDSFTTGRTYNPLVAEFLHGFPC